NSSPKCHPAEVTAARSAKSSCERRKERRFRSSKPNGVGSLWRVLTLPMESRPPPKTPDPFYPPRNAKRPDCGGCSRGAFVASGDARQALPAIIATEANALDPEVTPLELRQRELRAAGGLAEMDIAVDLIAGKDDLVPV